jgi:hypothetical protein
MKRKPHKPSPSQKRKAVHLARKARNKRGASARKAARGYSFRGTGTTKRRGPKKASAPKVRQQRKKNTDRLARMAFRGKANSKRRTSKKRLPRYSALKNPRQTLAHQKALAALRRMRRENLSLAKATRLEHIKPNTFLRHVGSAVHRSGAGKRWKPSKSDTLAARMRILTPQGPVSEIVRGLLERQRLARYEIALRKFRAGEDGAEEELLQYQGLTVAGHVLVTDLNLLIQLEEAGQLDFDSLYFSTGRAL